MTWTDLAVFALSFGFTARTTRFINDDKLAEPIRDWVVNRFGAGSKMFWLAVCAWCLSIWVAAAVAVTLAATGLIPWFAVIPYAFTLSYAYGLAATRLDVDPHQH